LISTQTPQDAAGGFGARQQTSFDPGCVLTRDV
jgi:hypothetical protein